MAVGPSTLAKVDNILKEVIEPGVRDQLQSEVLTMKRIESTSEGVGTNSVGGKYVRFAVRTGRNHGIGARREMEALPAARTQSYEDAQVSLAYLYGALQFSGQVLELADSNPQAFASALTLETDGLKETLAKDMNRQVYGTSRGTLMTAASGTTTTAVTTNADGKYMEIDMRIDIWDANVGAFDANGPFTVTNVVAGAANTTVTFTPASANAVAVGDLISRQGSSINATTGKEIVGLREIISDTGALFTIDPATTPVWASTVNSNSGTNRALSEGLMIKMVHDIRIKGARPSVIFTSLGVQRSYFNLLSQQREFVNTESFTGGYEGLAFAGAGGKIPMIEDVDCPSNRLFFVSEKELTMYKANDWSFMSKDGSNWNRVSDASGHYDAYSTDMFKYCQLGTKRRNAHGLLSDITEG